MKKTFWMWTLILSGLTGAASADSTVWLVGRGGTVDLKNWPSVATTYAGPGTLNLPNGQTISLALKAVVVNPNGKVDAPYELKDLDGDGLVDARPITEAVVASRKKYK